MGYPNRPLLREPAKRILQNLDDIDVRAPKWDPKSVRRNLPPLPRAAQRSTTPAGKLLFEMTGAFAECERSMIRQRVRAGLSVIKAKIERDGKFVSKAGKVRQRLGRPRAEADKLALARRELAKGTGVCKAAKLTGLGTRTVHKLRRQMEGDDARCKRRGSTAADLER